MQRNRWRPTAGTSNRSGTFRRVAHFCRSFIRASSFVRQASVPCGVSSSMPKSPRILGGNGGGRVNDHLMGNPARLTRGVQQVLPHRLGKMMRSPAGLTLTGHGPHHLLQVERIDIGVNHNDDLGVAQAVRC